MTDTLNAALDKLGVTDNDTRAGVGAICSVEGPDGRPEISYAHTSINRIRQVFGRLRNYTDAELEEAKVDPEKWFELVYGGMYGNDEPGDGYKYRGRGPIQLTFHDNYQHVGDMIGYDLAGDPDLVSRDPRVGALAAAAYIVWRYKGGGFEAMLKCVGNNTDDIRRRKLDAYEELCASGEFDYDPSRKPAAVAEAAEGTASLVALAIDFIAKLFRRG